MKHLKTIKHGEETLLISLQADPNKTVEQDIDDLLNFLTSQSL